MKGYLIFHAFWLLLAYLSVVAVEVSGDHENKSLSESLVPWNGDMTDLKACALLSSIAYCKSSTISLSLEDAGFTDIQVSGKFHDDTLDVHGFVGLHTTSNKLCIVFRGTELFSAANWIENFKYQNRTSITHICDNCSVHKGFYEYHLAVHHQIVNLIYSQMYQHQITEILLTGHSMGGAVAAIEALVLQNKFPTIPIRLVSFGSPRVLNHAAAEYTRQVIPNTLRVTHYKDLFVHLPHYDMGYVHTTGEVYYGRDTDNVVMSCEGFENSLCADKWTRWLGVLDHFNYLNIAMECPCEESSVVISINFSEVKTNATSPQSSDSEVEEASPDNDNKDMNEEQTLKTSTSLKDDAKSAVWMLLVPLLLLIAIVMTIGWVYWSYQMLRSGYETIVEERMTTVDCA